MKKRIISVFLAVCMILTMATACGNNEPITAEPSESAEQKTDAEQEQESETKSKTVIFTDSTGREVEVPSDITKIAPSGPLAQIVLFAVAPEMLVGLSSEWNPGDEQYIAADYYNLPVLGQFYGKGELNLEEVVRVDPQIIIDIGEAKSTIVEDMDGIQEQLNIPTVHIDASTSTMGEAYRMLGDLLGKKEEAEAIATYCDDVYKNTRDIMAKVGEDGKAKLIYSLGKDGLNVLAKGAFQAEIIDMVSNNIAVVEDISNKGTGNPVDMEQLILWDPDIILFEPGGAYSIAGDSETWQQLKAIKNGNYYEVPMGPYNWIGSPPSVNRYMGMIWSTQLLYPEQAQYNLYEETAKYYKLFYHCDLTQEQYEELVADSILK
jgi:iron complex transport system substrate-binding protein